MGRLCIIPARGGSKRIHKKNIKEFSGAPIISYSIKVALQSGLFSEVMVSTDDEEIARIAKSYGAAVPFFRTDKNSDDFATTMDVILEVVNRYDEELNRKFDQVCCLYPTAPLVSSQHLIDGLELLQDSEANCVHPVLEYSFPIQRALKRDDEGWTTFLEPANKNKRSQDLEESYHDAGQWYWYETSALGNSKNPLIKSIIIDPLFAQDIDNQSDWKMAELKYRMLNSEE